MKTRRFKEEIPPEKGEETGIAMDNMKPSGSCPEKIEVVVVVVVVECYCFLIKIIVVGVEPRRDALVYAPCVFCLKISIGLAKRLECPKWVRCCCSPFPVKVALFRAFRLCIKTLKFDLAVNSRSFRGFLRHGNAKKLLSSTRRWFF